MKKKFVIGAIILALGAGVLFWVVKGEDIKEKAIETAVEAVVEKVAEEAVEEAKDKLIEEVIGKLIP